MADWVNIPDTALDPDAPLTSELAYAWRNNPIAMAEGAAGAPRIEDGAMGASATAVGAVWIGARYALAAWGDVGSVILAVTSTNPYQSQDIQAGTIIPGSALRTSNAGGIPGSGIPSGNWMCLGFANGSSGSPTIETRSTLWKRVS